MEKPEIDQKLKRAQELAHRIEELESIDVKAAYEKTQAEIHRRNRSRWMQHLTRVAAILTLPLLIATAWLVYDKIQTPEKVEQNVLVRAALGTVIRYELPDKSVAWLYSGSTLSYPATFEKEHRDVKLDGMAYFEVEADQKKPFFVHTESGASVYVYGTKFNMASYADDPFVEVVLEKGHVNLVTPAMKQYKLEPGEGIDYDKKSGEVTKKLVNIKEKTAWLEGKLIFRDTEVDEIFTRLSRHFNVDIQVNNPHHRTFRYHATFADETLHQILTYLSASAKMTWTITKGEHHEDGTVTRDKVVVNIE